MSPATLDARGLQSCANLVHALLPEVRTVHVLDATGKVLWQSGPAASVPEPEWFTGKAAQWTEHEEGVRSLAVSDSRQLVAISVRAGVSRRRYIVCLTTQAGDAASTQPVRAAAASLGEILVSDFALNDELTSMTDELIRRYEELNLVYDTEDETRHLEEGLAVFRQIVANCTSYLNVDLTALTLFDRDTFVVSSRDGHATSFDTELIRDPQQPPIAWIRSHQESLVANTAEELAKAGLSGDFKIIVTPLRDSRGEIRGALSVVNDASRRDFENGDRNLLRVMADKASRIVRNNYDTLTGLMSRDGLERAVQTALPLVREERRRLCLLHANIDQLQLVNDTLGHEVGDDLIKRISDVLRAGLRGGDKIARLGGDEFGILLRDCSLENASRMADRLCRQVSDLECRVGSRHLDVGISVGVAPVDESFQDVISAMAAADLACAAAKEQGRNRAYVYRPDDEEMHARKEQMHWVGRIQRAVRDDRFVLFAQEIAPTVAGRGQSHYEILLRMLDDDDRLLAPGQFMPVAERYGMMPAVDRWVIRRALAQLSEAGGSSGAADAIFAINLSGQSITDRQTLSLLIRELRAGSVDADRICLEITETEAISDLSNAQNFIRRVKDLGCRFALDDFGAGVTSFTNLRALDVDYLKIDGSFVRDMISDPVSAAMVAAINQVGQTMQLETVAEFVENDEIRQKLCELGVDFVQGYGIGRPQPLADLLDSLTGSTAQSA